MRRRTFIAAAPVLLVAACTSAPPAPPAIAVFFTADSATLEPEALQVVQGAAQAAKATAGSVVVLGFAGPAGGVAYNVALSEARAQQVADQLVRDGVARERISIVPRGPVPFEAVPTESRRVEIRIGG
jgi:outer membrane protein OmpA-like peptidoglycan-associated protein